MNDNRCSLHRKLDLGELFIVDSGPAEASFIVAAKAKSFVCQVRAVRFPIELLAQHTGCPSVFCACGF